MPWGFPVSCVFLSLLAGELQGRTLNYRFILSGNVNPFSFASFSPRASAMPTALTDLCRAFSHQRCRSCQAPLPVKSRRHFGPRRGSDMDGDGDVGGTGTLVKYGHLLPS